MPDNKSTSRIKSEPKKETPEQKKPKEISAEPTITLNAADLTTLVANIVKEVNKSNPNRDSKNSVSRLNLSLKNKINERIRQGDMFNKQFAEDNARMTIRIGRAYQKYAGKELTVTINTSTVKIPVDGRAYQVHPAHYAIAMEKIKFYDSLLEREQGQTSNNVFGEPSTGDFAKV